MDGAGKKLYSFSYILGYSRYRYVEFTVDIGTQGPTKMPMNAFPFTGGISSNVFYDNMKRIVLDRRLKSSESRFNKDFVRFGEYYGLNVRLRYPYKPQSKWKIGRTICFLKGNFFNGRAFSDLSDLN